MAKERPVPETQPRPTHPVAQIYLVRALDAVLEVAQAVSEDFPQRAHFYAHVPDDVARLLANFRSLPGKHPEWPDVYQRAFTSGHLVNRFLHDFAGIRLSAIRFIQSGLEAGELIARRALIEAAALLRASIQPLEGAAASAIERANSGMLKRAFTVLSSRPVSAAFGVSELPAGDWPDGGIFGPQLAYLCESVSKMLPLEKPINQPTLSLLQRAAHYGELTINGVLDPSFTDADSNRVSEVAQSASAWATVLGELSLRMDIARAWTDPQYRNSLQPLQTDMMPPNP